MATVGGIKEVPSNENSIEVDELARFAVDEHNKKEVWFSFSYSILSFLNWVLFCFLFYP